MPSAGPAPPCLFGWPEEPEGPLGPGHLAPSVLMAEQSLKTWPAEICLLSQVWALTERPSLGAGRILRSRLTGHAGHPPLSQGLDLRRGILSLRTSPFLVRTDRNICFGGISQEHGYLTMI